MLLDWSQPWLFLRQLREWLLLLRGVLSSLNPECLEALEENGTIWKERGRSNSLLNLDGTKAPETSSAPLPLGPGEWEDNLGLPLCVVCQNVSTASSAAPGPVC